VTFEVAAGRPFSELERLVLRAIAEGANDLQSMQIAFHVHPRILIEALVTLTQAGWVALSGAEGGGFLLTSDGARAFASNRPPSTTVTTTKHAFLLLERLTGGLIGNDEVRFRNAAQLEAVWDDAVRLPADCHDNSLDEGQVRRLLPRRQGEWVRWIGPIDMLTKGAHWVAVGVDTTAGTIVGLPERWRARLEPVVLEEARRREDRLSTRARARQWAPDRDISSRMPAGDEDTARRRVWPVDLEDSDLVVGGQQHEAVLLSALEQAVSSLFVASAFLTNLVVERLRDPILSALRRGVNIDLLWGYAVNEQQGVSPLETLKKLAYEAKKDGASGVLRWNQSPSGSHAKLVLVDKASGMEGCLGSYNWLSAFGADGRQDTLNVSVSVHEPALVAELCGCAAGLWASADSEALSSSADRWRSAAAELERRAAESEDGERGSAKTGGTSAALVFDRDHEGILRELAASAQQVLLVLSHRLGPVAESRLIMASEAKPSEYLVVYGHSEVEPALMTSVDGLVQRSGGTLVHVPSVHAKVVVSDSTVCISSYNFLSADPFGKSRRARELGIVLDGGALSARLSEHVRAVFRAESL
jgi:hypothetical protein